MATIIIKLEHSNLLQHSREGVKIQKIVSSISPLTFIKLLFKADTKVNPRTATVNPITKSIYETLDKSPELFWYKTKGILLSTEECEILDRGRVRISLDNADYEGIMDGGHNTFAIARFIIDKLYGISFKTWDECKKFWDENYDNVLERFEQVKEQFKFSIPIEILSPSDETGALDEFSDYISEICSARNNNVQLRETAKGNQVGYYEYLKDKLYDYKIIWKTGSIGKIKAEDVISLATLPLLFLQDKGLLPQDIKTLNKISIYSQKSKCVDYFNEVLAHSAVSEGEKGKYILKNEIVKSALDLVEDIIKFYDKLYFEFPDLYGTSHGKFGRIGEVKIKENDVPFGTIEEKAKYQYPHGYFYPLLCGLTNLMKYDEHEQKVVWKINPMMLNFEQLDFSQYIALIKMLNYDPQKVGKTQPMYREAENIFDKVM